LNTHYSHIYHTFIKRRAKIVFLLLSVHNTLLSAILSAGLAVLLSLNPTMCLIFQTESFFGRTSFGADDFVLSLAFINMKLQGIWEEIE